MSDDREGAAAPSAWLAASRAHRPLLITGASAPLGQACARVCQARARPYLLLSRAEMDTGQAASVEAALSRWQPWAVVDAESLERLLAAAPQPPSPREAAETVARVGPLARACSRAGVGLLTFSIDRVFAGTCTRPRVESDPPQPADSAGAAALRAEQLTLALAPHALVVRTGPLFSPWERSDFLALALATVRRGERVISPCDSRLSPTHAPDLIEAALDLLAERAQGVWHLAQGGCLAWDAFVRMAAQAAGLDPAQVQGAPAASLDSHAPPPRWAALASERGLRMPPLEEGLRRYLQMLAPDAAPPPRRWPAPPVEEAPADWTVVADDLPAGPPLRPLPWPPATASRP